MSAQRGRLYLVPAPLDFGTHAERDIADLLPLGVLAIAARTGHWLAESAKTARAFLKRVDVVCPLHRPLQEIAIVELPRPPKGRVATATGRVVELLAPALAGHDLGLVSEAGLPVLADPGAAVVAAAHAEGLDVVALPGASALALAVAASGLDGQSFAFVGYLPIQPDARAARIRELEATSRSQRQTQVMIETPYRNDALLRALVAVLQPTTTLAVSIGLTTPVERTRSGPVERWKSSPLTLPGDVPGVFSLQAR